ncbi:MAG: glycerophosphoryl diester phosphodiesterase membrane domain-containing protein [Candidatus Nanopelagicales bacterium]
MTDPWVSPADPQQPVPPQPVPQPSPQPAPQPRYGAPAPQGAGWQPPAGWSTEQPAAWGAANPPAGNQQAGNQQAGTAQPGQPGYAGPGLQPGYAQPGYAQPGYPQPGYAQPGYQQVPPNSPGWGRAAPLAPKPGIVPLRPLGVGELLDGALGLIRSNPRTVIGLATVISAISALVQTIGLGAATAFSGLFSTQVSSDIDAEFSASLSSSLAQMITQLVPSIVTAFLQILASGLFIVLVGAAVLGRRLNSGQTWALLRPRIGPLLLLSVMLFALGLVAAAIVVGVVAALFALLGGFGAALGVVVAILAALVAIYVSVRLSLASPALVMEGIGPLAALRRSWRLVTGSFWRVLGITVLAAVIVYVLSSILTVPFIVVATVFSAMAEAAWPVIVAMGLATLLSGIITLPFSAAVTGLLYTDLRIRREALDIRLISAGVDPSGDPLAPYRQA